ncbi:oxidoreductase [Lithospermum erythrorhizon]|uniref:Oxidoreductase n=1 Tax=Lithospermum erythrorhizon TaxID=34254 RepID=A0AAV3RY11_LITER
MYRKPQPSVISWPMNTLKMGYDNSTTRNDYASPERSEVIVFHSPSKWRIHFEASKATSKLMVIYFTAIWCGPCKFMEPAVHDLADHFPDVEFIQIDVDELMNVAEEFGVRTMPTFLLLKKGVAVDKIVGTKKEDLQIKIEKHIA